MWQPNQLPTCCCLPAHALQAAQRPASGDINMMGIWQHQTSCVKLHWMKEILGIAYFCFSAVCSKFMISIAGSDLDASEAEM